MSWPHKPELVLSPVKVFCETSSQVKITQLHREAEQGYAEKQYLLGRVYYLGQEGVAQYKREALKWY
jgi:TPR repeat protein